MRKLIIVKIDIAGGRRKLDCCDVEIAIALILIGPTTTGANLRKLRMHDRAIHIRALIYELVISVILLTTPYPALTCILCGHAVRRRANNAVRGRSESERGPILLLLPPCRTARRCEDFLDRPSGSISSPYRKEI